MPREEVFSGRYRWQRRIVSHLHRCSSEERRDVIYVLDGGVVTIARSASNLEYFCRTGNGMGELHYPKVKEISAQEVSSGIA